MTKFLIVLFSAKQDSKEIEADSEALTPSEQSPEDTSTDAAPSSHSVTEPAPPQSHSQEKAKEPFSRCPQTVSVRTCLFTQKQSDRYSEVSYVNTPELTEEVNEPAGTDNLC